MEAYETLTGLWGWLRDITALSDTDLDAATRNLAEFYTKDFDASLSSEWALFRGLVVNVSDRKQPKQTMESFMLSLLLQHDLSSAFPNVYRSLCIYKTLMMSNASAERSMSKMKLVKSRIRASMSQDRFTDLVRMSLGSDIMRSMNFDDSIRAFAEKKARRRVM
eukprot:GHVU01221589.1.p1 GENE.GHVU01221589.1~~GHVU01221589.1.p1  ORF type:complete len:164 (-),score=11.65 GHVU01221589.1:581-1072(-)